MLLYNRNGTVFSIINNNFQEASLLASIKINTGDAERVRDEINLRDERLKAKTDAILKLEEDVKNLTVKHKKSEVQLESEKAALKGQIEELQKQKKALEKNNKDLSTKMENQKQENDKYTKEKDALTKQLADIKYEMTLKEAKHETELQVI